MFGAAPRRFRAGGRFRILVGVLLAVAGSAPVSFPGGPAFASAQIKVEGEVLDKVTGLPVAGVIVHLPDLGVGTLSDEFGYFLLDAVPRGAQVVSVHRAGYEALEQEVRVIPGEVWEVRLTPTVFSLSGVEVTAATGAELEAATTGRRSDFISPSQVAEAAGRTNKLLEVLRSKAPPRLRIRQKGGLSGVTFCIESSRRRPSVQELIDLGTGCRPALLALDGVIVYAPPAMTEMARAEPPSLPADVAALLLDQNPEEIRSIRVLSPADAFFRYGDAGRSGAVEIVTVHPGRPKGS
ncbi:MAG: carboxypeptidase-like regulatory domain-containing protein [Gemmatimonadetes bacterium]|nr:carboxypeptidase-like regulatory domain-containing protein [Gemmatimonadota bacterium]